MTRRWFAVLIAAALGFSALRAEATWKQLTFTAPGDAVIAGQYRSGVARYRVEAWNGTRWDSVMIYRSPGVIGVPPAPMGTLVTAYVDQPANTGRTYRLAAIDSAGNRAYRWSNLVAIVAGVPRDTLWWLTRNAEGLPPCRWTVASSAVWQLMDGDTATVFAVHDEWIQLANKDRICRLYGYVALRGVRDSSLCGVQSTVTPTSRSTRARPR